jgi:HK97 family phage portal protein
MLFGSGTKTKAGQYVGEDAALKLAPFFSGVSLIASSIASMPWCIDRKLVIEGQDRSEHIASHLLYYRPNQLFTPFTFKEWIIWRALMKGNAYILIDKGEDDMFAESLWPLEPDLVKPYLDSKGAKKFDYTLTIDGKKEIVTYDNNEVMQIPGFMYDGVRGYGILDFCRESIGLGLAVEEFGARFFAGDGQATGIITHPMKLKKEAKINIKESYKEQSKGLETASNSQGRGVVVLDEGMTFNKTGISPEEGQFLGTREFSVEEVCRWLHIPPFMLAVGTTAAALSAEEQYNFFVSFCLRAWLDKINQEANVKLINKVDSKTYESRFDTKALTLMTEAVQLANFSAARNMGLLTLNNISTKYNTPLLPKGDDEGRAGAGDQRIVPSTMKVLGDTDPSTPVPMEVMNGFYDLLRNSKKLTTTSARAVAKLLMPTADVKLINKILKPFLSDMENDDADEPDEDDVRPDPSKTGGTDKSGNKLGKGVGAGGSV